ncbi:MAG: zincin-like metallopeptidase domain-containing protein [Bacilli bacterium]|jgi:antirestriction protein ArdC
MNLYEVITDKIVKALEQGTVPWRKPWKTTAPKNAVTKKLYRGINVLLLGMGQYGSPHWATFRQIASMGGSVKKGEHGTLVVYSSRFKVQDRKTGEEKELPFLKQYSVFNLEQTNGIELPDERSANPVMPIGRCEKIVGSMPKPPSIALDGGSRAFYRPITDSVSLPLQRCFESAEEYYSTLFHELVHSTGHSSRLARKGVAEAVNFGSDTYGNEELIAEIGAAFLCGQAGIDCKTLDNSAAYVAGWLKTIRADKKIVVIAAAQAQKAVDYISSNPTTSAES